MNQAKQGVMLRSAIAKQAVGMHYDDVDRCGPGRKNAWPTPFVNSAEALTSTAG